MNDISEQNPINQLGNDTLNDMFHVGTRRKMFFVFSV